MIKKAKEGFNAPKFKNSVNKKWLIKNASSGIHKKTVKEGETNRCIEMRK
jgi:hypothetical protein